MTEKDSPDDLGSRLVAAPKASPLLRGYRGAAPVDVAELGELVARIGLLVDEVSSLASLDLNPVLVSTGVVAVLGATATVRARWQRVDLGIRRLLDG